jgi:hypothetical protein
LNFGAWDFIWALGFGVSLELDRVPRDRFETWGINLVAGL